MDAIGVIADCYDAMNSASETAGARRSALQRTLGGYSTDPAVLASRICVKADTQIEGYFCLPQSRALQNQRKNIESIVWRLLDIARRFELGYPGDVPTPIEVSNLRWFSHAMANAAPSDKTFTDESFEVLRIELRQVEDELEKHNLDANLVAMIGVQIRYVRAVLDETPVDVDMLISRASSLIGTLAICARNSTGAPQKKFAQFFQRFVSAVAFDGFAGAVSEITVGLMQDALEGSLQAPGEEVIDAEIV